MEKHDNVALLASGHEHSCGITGQILFLRTNDIYIYIYIRCIH